MTIVVIEEFAGQHEDLRHPGRPPLCKCERPGAVRDSDSCLYCGRYIEALFSPIVTSLEAHFSEWSNFVRARPHAEVG